VFGVSRTLIVSDIHANAPALKAVIENEPAVESVIFVGDAVDVGPHPDAVCDRLRDLPLVAAVQGNHDRAVLNAADVSPNNVDPHTQWQHWTYSELAGENHQFLRTLDRTTTFSHKGRTLRLHHGDFSPPEGYDGEWEPRTTPADDTAVFEAVAARYDEDVILHGHSHYPFEETVDGTTFVNPGSVGLQREGWPADRARYAVLKGGEFELRAVTYSTEQVTADARDLGGPYDDHWDRNG
jgi:putative phosphoesterase